MIEGKRFEWCNEKTSYGLMAWELMHLITHINCRNRSKNGLIALEGLALYIRVISRISTFQSKKDQKLLTAAADKIYEIAKKGGIE